MSEDIRWEEPPTPELIAAQVGAVVRAIEQSTPPDRASISHFGLHMVIGTESVNISDRGSHLMVTIYREHARPLNPQVAVTCPTCGHTKQPPFYQHPGYSLAVHQQRMFALASEMRTTVHDSWNGLAGQNGVSVVLDCPPPESLAAAMRRGLTGVDYGAWVSSITNGAAS